MARILYLYAQPHRAGSEHARRAMQMLFVLKSAGHTVDVLSLPGGDPWPEGLVEGRFLSSGVPFIRSLPLYGRGFRRIWASIAIFLAALRLLFRTPYDAVHCSDRAIRCAGVLAWLFRKPLIFEWYTTASGRDLVSWLARRARCFRRSIRMVFSDVQYPLSRLREIEVNGRIAVVQMLPSPAIVPLENSFVERGERRMSFRVVAMSFARDLGDLTTFSEALPALFETTGLRVEIVGSTPREIDRFRLRLQGRLGEWITRVAFRPAIGDTGSLLSILEGADLVFMPAVTGPIAPVRLIDVMAARRAILAVRCGAYQTLLNETNGRLVSAHAEEIRVALQQLIENRHLCTLYAEAACETIARERNVHALVEDVRRCYSLALGEDEA